jgi:hypothetical protein
MKIYQDSKLMAALGLGITSCNSLFLAPTVGNFL